MGFWNNAAGELQRSQPIAQKEDVLRRRRLVNGHVEGREDRARLCGRHGAAARELHQGRSIEATEHDADLYVFRGNSGKLIKILWHDGLGMSLYAKRLERGRFLWPSPADGVVTITPAQLGYLLEGIDWRMPQHTWRPQAAG
jgi:transposase